MTKSGALTHASSRCAAALVSDADLVHAAELASRTALSDLRGVSADLAMVFVSGDDSDEVEAALLTAARQCGAATTLGSVAASGVIANGSVACGTSSVSVWLGALPGAKLQAFHLEVIRTPESIAVVGMPQATEDARIGLVMADAWSFPVEGFVDHSAVAYPGLILAGGLAAGQQGAGSTRLLIDERVVDRGAVGVLISGDVGVATAVSQGCRPIGPAMTVTASDGNLVTSLAGQTPLNRLQGLISTLDPNDQALVTTGLQIGIARDEYVDEPDQGDYVIRGVLGLDRTSGAMAIGDVVEVGQTVRFQIRDAQAADADLITTLGSLRRQVPDPTAAGVLLFSCNGRAGSLFSSPDHDSAVVHEAFPHAALGGFFAAGEIGPVAGSNLLHGFSASIVVFTSPADTQEPDVV